MDVRAEPSPDRSAHTVSSVESVEVVRDRHDYAQDQPEVGGQEASR